MNKWLGLFCVVVAGCSAGAPSDTDPDGDTDIADDQPLVNELVYQASRHTFSSSGVSTDECTARLSLTPSEYTGACDGCDWAFEVQATQQGGGCAEILPEAMFEAEDGGTLILGFSSTIQGYPGHRNWLGGFETADQYIEHIIRGSYDYQPFTVGVGSFSLDGESLDWTASVTQEPENWRDEVFDPSSCSTTLDTEALDAPVSSTQLQGDVPCNLLFVDVYDLQVTAGTTVRLSVDTQDSATALDPRLTVLSADGCRLASGIESIRCSSPSWTRCDGLEFEPPATATHQVVVRSRLCLGEGRGNYTLGVSGATATLVMDDAPNYAQGTAIEGSWRANLRLPSIVE